MKGPEIEKKKVPKLNLDFKVPNEYSITPKAGISSLNHRLATDTPSLPDINAKSAKEKTIQYPQTTKNPKTAKNFIDLGKLSHNIDETNKNFLLHLRSLNEKALTSLDYDRLGRLGLDQKFSTFNLFSEQSYNDETTMGYLKSSERPKSKTVTENPKNSNMQIQTERIGHETERLKDVTSLDTSRNTKVPPLTAGRSKFNTIMQKIGAGNRELKEANTKLTKLESINSKTSGFLTKRNSNNEDKLEEYFNDSTERQKVRKVSLKENSREHVISAISENKHNFTEKEVSSPSIQTSMVRDESKKHNKSKLKSIETPKSIYHPKSETENSEKTSEHSVKIPKEKKSRADLSFTKSNQEKSLDLARHASVPSTESPIKDKGRFEEKLSSMTKTSIQFTDQKQSTKRSPEKTPKKMSFSPLTTSREHSMRSNIPEKSAFLFENNPTDNIIEPQYLKFSSKFTFRRKKIDSFQRKANGSFKSNSEEEYHTYLEDDFLKSYDLAIKNIAKSNPSNILKSEADSKAINNTRKSANLEELLKDDEEDRRDELDERPPSIQKKRSTAQTVFSFKDQTITINIKPPIEEIHEVNDESEKYEDDGSPTANRSPTHKKELIYKFDVKVKNNENEDSFYQDIAEIKDESSKRRTEELFTFDEIYQSNIDHISFKSFKSTCKTNFFTFLENLMSFPTDYAKHKEHFEKLNLEKDANPLEKPLGFYYDQKYDLYDLKGIEFKTDAEADSLSFITKEEIIKCDKKLNQGFDIENDLKKNEALGEKNQLLLLNGDEYKIVSEVQDWKIVGREVEKKSLVNFFDHLSFSKRLSHYFLIEKDMLVPTMQYQEEQQRKYRYFGYLIATLKEKNFNYFSKLIYKTYLGVLYGNFEHITVLGEERIIKRREKKDKMISKIGNRVKRRNNKVQAEETDQKEKIDDITLKSDDNTKEMSVIAMVNNGEKSNRNHSVRPFELITPSETRTSNMLNLSPRHASSIVGQSHQPSLDFNGNRLKLKSDTEKLSVRMKTEELSSVEGGDSSKSSVRKKSETLPKNETLQRLETSYRHDPQKVESLQRMETTMFKETAKSEAQLQVIRNQNEIPTRHSLTTDIKSKFAEINKKETLNTPSVPSHSTLPTHQDESIREPRISQRLSPAKSEANTKPSYPSRENLSKNDIRDDSAKSNEIKIKADIGSPEHKVQEVGKSKKTIMNQSNQKMVKSSSILRTHVLIQKRKEKMTPEEKFFEYVHENKPQELMDMLSYYPREYIDVRGDKGDTLLMLAAKCGHFEIITPLINSKIDINAQNTDGNTALHNALAYGHHEIADELIKHGAKQNLRNNQGKLAWEVAI